MNFLNKMERKYGKYSVRNLPTIIIALYVAGYVLETFQPAILYYLTLEPYRILHGEVWRILTWILIPPDSLNLFTIIMLYFYYSIGKNLFSHDHMPNGQSRNQQYTVYFRQVHCSWLLFYSYRLRIEISITYYLY